MIYVIHGLMGKQTGDLVKDWRRMNVSFTRARSKLIVFGSKQTLEATSLLKKFFELMDEKNWVLKMPNGAHTLHASMVQNIPDVTNRMTEPPETKNGVSDDIITEVIDQPTGEAQLRVKRLTPSKRRGDATEKENALCGDDGARFSKGDENARALKKMRKNHEIDADAVKGGPWLLDLINKGL